MILVLPLPNGHVQEWRDVDGGVPVADDLIGQRRPLVLPVVDVLLLDLLRRLAQVVLVVVAALQLHLLLGANDRLDAGPGPGVDDVVPMPGAAGRKLHVPLDEQDAGVANLTAALLVEAEALLEQGLIPLAVGEAGAGRQRT